MAKTKAVGRDLSAWQVNHWRGTLNRIKKLEDEFAGLQSRGFSSNSIAREEALKVEISALKLVEERVWRQKSREVWLKDGTQIPGSFTRRRSLEGRGIISVV